jgi:hypothetical protein
MKGNGAYVFLGAKKKYELLLNRDQMLSGDLLGVVPAYGWKCAFGHE